MYKHQYQLSRLSSKDLDFLFATLEPALESQYSQWVDCGIAEWPTLGHQQDSDPKHSIKFTTGMTEHTHTKNKRIV